MADRYERGERQNVQGWAVEVPFSQRVAPPSLVTTREENLSAVGGDGAESQNAQWLQAAAQRTSAAGQEVAG